jgi:hypothetical protein
MINAIKTAKKFFGKSNIKKIEQLNSPYINKYKIAVFVPPENADALSFAMASAGAGVIGNYTVCSFRTKGTGTFIGGENSTPAAGEKGRFEKVEEIRLEMICNKENLDPVTNKILEVHPYEEPAYEIYEVLVKGRTNSEEIFKITLNKRTAVKSVLKKINNSIDASLLPDAVKNKKVKQVILDFSGQGGVKPEKTKTNTLLIETNKNLTNIKII